MIAGRDSGDAARERVRVEVEHHGEGAAWLEAPRPLKELFLEPDSGRGADGCGQSVVHQIANRCDDDQVAQSCAVGPNGLDGGRVASLRMRD